MKELIDLVSLYIGYVVLSVASLFIILFIYLKLEELIDHISYKIWLKKRGK
jgi:hypothetical protein